LKAFRVNLKACLGLALPDQYSPSSKIEVGFRVILFRGPCLLLRRPYYEPLLWFMIFTEQSALLICSGLPNYNNDCSPVLASTTSIGNMLFVQKKAQWTVKVSAISDIWSYSNRLDNKKNKNKYYRSYSSIFAIDLYLDDCPISWW